MWSFFNDKQWDYIHGLYRQGYPIRHLAKWLLVSENTIRCAFRRKGFNMSVPKQPLSDFTEEFKSLGSEHGNQAVAQLDPETQEVLAVYESVALAGVAVGVRPCTIYGCITGENPTAGGYKWARASEVDNDCV